MKQVRITWKKSAIGYRKNTQATIQALGLRRVGHTVVKELTPSIAGMIKSVEFLVHVEETK